MAVVFPPSRHWWAAGLRALPRLSPELLLCAPRCACAMLERKQAFPAEPRIYQNSENGYYSAIHQQSTFNSLASFREDWNVLPVKSVNGGIGHWCWQHCESSAACCPSASSEAGCWRAKQALSGSHPPFLAVVIHLCLGTGLWRPEINSCV